MVLKVGSYAMSGSAIGSIFPVIGTLVGSVLGALVGIIMTVAGIFTSKASKIRKAQGKVRDRLEEARDKSLDSVADETRLLVAAIEKNLRVGCCKKSTICRWLCNSLLPFSKHKSVKSQH